MLLKRGCTCLPFGKQLGHRQDEWETDWPVSFLFRLVGAQVAVSVDFSSLSFQLRLLSCPQQNEHAWKYANKCTKQSLCALLGLAASGVTAIWRQLYRLTEKSLQVAFKTTQKQLQHRAARAGCEPPLAPPIQCWQPCAGLAFTCKLFSIARGHLGDPQH